MWQRTLFLQISPLAACFFFFFFYLVYAFCTACHAVCDCHLSPCVREQNAAVYFSHFLFHSFTHRPPPPPPPVSCAGSACGFANRCTMTALDEGRRIGPARHVRLLHPPVLGIPLLSFLTPFFFPDLSITNSASCRNGVTGGPCERSSEIDRQVRELIVVQDTSAGAQRYSSYTSPASPPLHHPASLRGVLPHSFASKLLFSPLLTLLESRGCSQEFIGCFPPPQYWSDLEKPRRFDISNTRLRRASQPAPAHAFSFPIACLVFHVWGKFWERSYASRDNMQLYYPPGFIQAHLGGDRVSALHCPVNYTSICLGLLYGYLWLCSKSKMISLKSRLSDITVFSPFWLREFKVRYVYHW